MSETLEQTRERVCTRLDIWPVTLKALEAKAGQQREQIQDATTRQIRRGDRPLTARRPPSIALEPLNPPPELDESEHTLDGWLVILLLVITVAALIFFAMVSALFPLMKVG